MSRILIVKLGAVGDCIHTLYALHSLRRSFPDGHIAWLVEGKSAQVVLGHPDLDNVYVFDRRGFVQGLRSYSPAAAHGKLIELIRRLRADRYDVAVDFQTLLKSGFFALASGADVRIGFDRWRELNRLFTNVRVNPEPADLHAVDKYMALVEAAGGRRCYDPPGVYVPDGDRAAVDRFFTEHGLTDDAVVAVNPAASWPNKRWPARRYGEAAAGLAEQGFRPVVLWGPGEEGIAREVVDASGQKAVLAPETGLKALCRLLERSALYLGNDSGPMHLAAVVGTPVVALFGPSDPARVGPLVKPSKVVKSEIDCAPCWKRECDDPKCIDRIEPGRVLEACLEVLRARR